MNALNDDALRRLLDDDAAYGDLTTATLGIGDRTGRFEFSARRAMRICGIEEAARLAELAGLSVRPACVSGSSLAAGAPILAASGSAAALHRAWKAAQVLIEWASGVASAAAEIVDAAGGLPVACTRKHAPGTKALSIKAVRAGGAVMHRLGLSETLLVFAEHRIFLDETATETVARIRASEPEKKLVVEVSDIEAAERWSEAGADVLQLEKFPPDEVARLVARLNEREGGSIRPKIAAAGGIDAKNAGAYAAAGADLIVTSAPFSAPPRDVAVRFATC